MSPHGVPLVTLPRSLGRVPSPALTPHPVQRVRRAINRVRTIVAMVVMPAYLRDVFTVGVRDGLNLVRAGHSVEDVTRASRPPVLVASSMDGSPAQCAVCGPVEVLGTEDMRRHLDSPGHAARAVAQREARKAGIVPRAARPTAHQRHVMRDLLDRG